MEHFNDLGRLGIGSRLKRISQILFAEVNTAYQDAGIDFDAALFPLLSLIDQKGPCNLRQAETMLGTSHAYISQSAGALRKKGLAQLKVDPGDLRSKILHISPKGSDLVKKARPLWQAMDRALADILFPDEEAFFKALSSFEKGLQKNALSGLTKRHLDNGAAPVDIVPYTPAFRDDFERLNREWLEKMFKVEPVDQAMFDDPQGTIIDKGGFILMALIEGECVGTCALLKNGDAMELCKMGVDPRKRGHGIGRQLIKASFEAAATQKKIRKIYLLSHSKLKSALHLYEACGFKDVPLTDADRKKYARADIRMEYAL